MISFIKILLCSSILYSSYSSMYGFGDYVEDDYLRSSFIMESSDYYVENNFSPIWLDSKSIFSFQYNFMSSNLGSKSLSGSNLSAVSYSFPLRKSMYCTIGFNPYTISDASFYDYNYKSLDSENISTLNESIIYNTLYSNDGGISKAYIDFSSYFFNKFYIGIKYSSLFGNLEQSIKIRSYELNYDQNEDTFSYSVNDSILINRVSEYRGGSVQLDSKYDYDNLEFILSGTYNSRLKVNSNYFYGTSLSNLEQIQTYIQPNQNISYKNKSMLKKVTLGLKYNLDDISYALLKLSKQNAFEYNSDSMYLPDPDVYSINIWYNLISKIFISSKLNYMNYRLGAFYKIMKFEQISDYDYGITFDYKIRLSDMNSYSIFFKAGNKTYNHIDLSNEKYYMVGLKLENLEDWFLKGAEK